IPKGALVVDGYEASVRANNLPWFGVFEDGAVMIGVNDREWRDAAAAHGAPQYAIGSNIMLVRNGEDATVGKTGYYYTERHPRSSIGLTADGKLIMAVLDGYHDPFSCGGTPHEMAEIMLEAGCVIAINIDGGGSSTFAMRPEGEDEVRIINRTSDGSERFIASSVIVASTAPKNEFDHADLSADDPYITPGTSTRITALGVGSSGADAAIPADAEFRSTLGTVVDGEFISDGTEGVAEITLVRNGETVGETQVRVVIPDAVTFGMQTIQVPLGNTVPLVIKASYGQNEVKVKPEDFTFTLSEANAGCVRGFSFTAGRDTSVTQTSIGASFNGGGPTAEAEILLERVHCPLCSSTNDLGEDIASAGQGFDDADGVLVCTVCGEHFSGVFEDGKTYEDGLPVEGWRGDSFYEGGEMLTGIAEADGRYYDFGEDGVCEGRIRYTGFIEKNGNRYCLKNGLFVSGWQRFPGEGPFDDEWYYFLPSINIGLNGDLSAGYFGYNSRKAFSFDNGKLRSGLWFSYDEGTKYCYGPGFCKREWRTIDGEEYYFDTNGYVLTGYQRILDNWASITSPYRWYHFDETTGKLIERLTDTGIVSIDGTLYYMEDGVSKYAGVISVGNDYYYGASDGTVVTDAVYEVEKTNGLIPAGEYEFDEDGKLVLTYGDANCDGKINSKDLSLMKKVISGAVEIEGLAYVNSDVNRDGNVNTRDLSQLKRLIAGQ
ncbi:MAG: phosphodiester glycosidase family protein, partial [Clostridia bacterium]|nr:phosphodiester glycosidase family protein [Clostridia bacterium]